MKIVLLTLLILFVLDRIPAPRFLEEKEHEGVE